MVNVREFIDNFWVIKLLYECFFCQKIYKSYSGIEYYLCVFKYDGIDVVGIMLIILKKGKG